MSLSPVAVQQFFDNNGRPLVGGLLFTYEAGTSTPAETYLDDAGTPNTNPIVLDYRGECRIWLDSDKAYKFVLSPQWDTDPPTKPIWTADNITSAASLADITQQFIGERLYPEIQDEIDVGAAIANYYYPYGVPNRYATNTTPGVTDMTTAIQTAVNVMIKGGWPVKFLPQHYLITAAIDIPSGQGWIIQGCGPVPSRIIQSTNNTPIFRFTGSLNHSWTIDSLWLEHANSQASYANGVAVAFVGDGAFLQSIAYNYTLSNIVMYRSRQLAAVISDGVNRRGIWSGWHRNLYIITHGGVVDYGANASFQRAGPNMRFENVYIRADDATLPLFSISGGQGEFHNIECNLNNHGMVYIDLKGGSSFKVGQIVMENGTYTGANCAVFNITDSVLDIDYLHLFGNSFTWSPGVGNSGFVFRFVGSSTSVTTLKCRVLDLVNFSGGTTAVLTGTMYVTNLFASAGDCSSEFETVKGLLTLSNAYLTSIPGSGAGLVTSVSDWLLPRWSLDLGDADYTITPGSSPQNLRFDTTLSAARTVTLPTGTANSNVFNGLTYRISRRGGGAYSLTVRDGLGNVFATFPSGTTGTVEIQYVRTDVASTSWRVVNTSIVTTSTYTVTNLTTDRTYDADTATTAEVADVLGTLLSDLKNSGKLP